MIKKVDSFQNRLRIALTNKGITQSELGRRTGINRQMISDYLRGKYEAKQDNVYLLAKALGVDEAWLMGLADQDKQSSENKQKASTIEEAADQYAHNFRAFNNLNISDEQIEAIKEITLGYLKSQGISDKDDKKN
ncbi:helix-turn-helix domain-containing protein [uncultured Limosilactobacillus sp.]|uniref:helix-turn-helix domain-containing protein n=1 Tax=uncultured Limosilactobacillus sp. TaxID=2837629 RepID=UPI0025F47B71|nr:helix-turn-helix domain-containing protein [uncultured Limosilactobacillus sp.]